MAPIPTATPPLLNPLTGIRCVAFDVYGTLLVSAAGEISTATHASGGPNPFTAVANLVGLPPGHESTLEESYHRIISAHHHRAHASGVRHPEVDIRAIWREVLATMYLPISREVELVALAYELAANPVWPMPGAQELVNLITRSGLRVAIVSNAQFYTPLILEELFGQSLQQMTFRPCVWSYSQGEAKPSSQPFHSLATSLGREQIEPGETLYVGNDMLNDIVAAQDRGFRTVLFAGDSRSLRHRKDMVEIRGRTPDAVITAFEQLPTVIGLH